MSFGADSNVRLDPFEEARETEGCARRQSGRRNVLVADGDAGPAPSLWRCLTEHGARSLGLAAPGIAAGGPADLVALDLEHPEIRARRAGSTSPRPSSSAARRRSCARPGSPAQR